MDVRSTRQAAPATPAAGAAWSPILVGEARAEALELVDVLAESISARQGPLSPDASLSSGCAGCAVLFAERARAGRGGSDEALSFLAGAVDMLARRPMGVSLYSGFPGVAWASDFVYSTLGPDTDDRAAAIDDGVLHVLRRPDWARGPYDLIYGLTGIGVYALSRWPRASAREMLTTVAGHLAGRASRDDDGAFWWTSPELLLGPRREQSPGGAVDLGVAHGMAGVIPLLARISRLDADIPRLDDLVNAATRWLFAHAVESPHGPTVPAFIDGESDPAPTRSAWCYGDPGVAATLLLAARDAPSPSWNRAALHLAIRAAERPEDQTGVRDAGLCHGSAGLAHLFNRMYQLTGEPVLGDAALHWLQRVMDDVRAAVPVLSTPTDESSVPWNGPGLLEGMTGIALALLAASSPRAPTWDSVFLVSSTPLEAASDQHV